MISRSVLANAGAYRTAFQTAKPFKHVCIDGFLEPEVAERALADFPAFDPKLALNEYGMVGGKAVNTRLAQISPFYSDVYRYLFTGEFLAAMSALTGIPDLIGDPSLYGGGTHENLHGQELDPHVDFNYVVGGGAHRRVNMLIYLNKVWDSSWGGDIEIHSNPRDPENNRVTSYRVDFNRAVIFETNEYSWHGFQRIVLPPDQRDKISRKCLSIYLYTLERPAEEIAGAHATFYVQRPLGERFAPGRVLTAEDVAELKGGFRNRDVYIESYQKQEERAGRREAELEAARRHVETDLTGLAAALTAQAAESAAAAARVRAERAQLLAERERLRAEVAHLSATLKLREARIAELESARRAPAGAAGLD